MKRHRIHSPLGVTASVVLVAMLAVTVGLFVGVRSAVDGEQRQLLHERTAEAGLVIGSLFGGIGQDLSILATTTRPHAGSTEMFSTASKSLLGAASTIGVAQVSGETVTVLASAGSGPAGGASVAGPSAALAERAVHTQGIVSGVFDDGKGRRLHFAVASTDGLVLYETLSFDMSKPIVSSGKNTPFPNLAGAVYAGTVPDPATLVLTSSRKLPLTGSDVERQTFTVGADHWLIVTKSTGPIVGSLAANSAWAVLAAGLLAAILATVLVETLARRRRYALALVDERTLELRAALEEQARLERDEREARHVAEAANRSKSEFLSRMSHELRTPLNAVLGFGQLLELDDLDGPQQEAVGQIVKGGRHLLGLINDVLDISRIETGNMAMSSEPVVADDLITEAVTLLRPLAAARRIDLRIDPTGPLAGTHVLADRQRLKQILLNLLSNAVKYNHADGTVTVTCHNVDDRDLRITVTDIGPGIKPDDLDRLFVPFERLGAERTDIEGSGVGLALARRLADAMGGTVGVASTLGRGSSFWVQLPVVESPEQRYERLSNPNDDNEDAAPSPPPERRHKVLYIEDNPSNVRLVERILAKRNDIEVIAAMQGRIGLSLAHDHVSIPRFPGHLH